MKKIILSGSVFVAAFAFQAVAQVDVIPPGTEVVVRTNEWINSHHVDGRIYTATVNRDILDRDGHVAIPRGSQVELIARRYAPGEMTLDLESINADGRRYVVEASGANLNGGEREGVGGNERTAKYVGGGAVIGSIIGAIAGGGKGAAIGALAGGATGAGTEMATRGHEIHVPPESILTFRLERPIHLAEGPDTGYMRDGYHYHH